MFKSAKFALTFIMFKRSIIIRVLYIIDSCKPVVLDKVLNAVLRVNYLITVCENLVIYIKPP